jgi:hypothetical protein
VNVALALAVAVTLASFQTAGSPRDDHAAALARAETLWKSRQPQSYEFTLEVNCFCRGLAKTPPTFRITDGRPASIRAGIDEVLSDPYSGFNTVEKLFDAIRRKLAFGQHKFNVQYDRERGFPVSADMDPSSAIRDEELAFRVTGFQPR